VDDLTTDKWHLFYQPTKNISCSLVFDVIQQQTIYGKPLLGSSAVIRSKFATDVDSYCASTGYIKP